LNPQAFDADEFIRRVLLHVLPKGFRRIRHFGFLANACRAAKLPAIRAALQAPEPAPTVEPADYRERYAILTGHRIDLCPICGGCMVEIGLWPRSPSPLSTAPRYLMTPRLKPRSSRLRLSSCRCSPSERRAMPAKPRARACVDYLLPKCTRLSSLRRESDLFIITDFSWLNRIGRIFHSRAAGTHLERP
jgi:hypothetical protein